MTGRQKGESRTEAGRDLFPLFPLTRNAISPALAPLLLLLCLRAEGWGDGGKRGGGDKMWSGGGGGLPMRARECLGSGRAGGWVG